MKTIYSGSDLCPEMAIQDDKKDRMYGWLFTKHLDGQWVSIAKPDLENEEIKKIEALHDHLMQVEPKDLNVGDCFELIGYQRDGLKDIY